MNEATERDDDEMGEVQYDIQLTACPFCGSELIDPKGWKAGDGRAGPSCDSCGATAESVEAWETRAPGREIDPKYVIRGGQIVKASTGEPIPDDEPLILFRGRDRLALPMLEHYQFLAVQDDCTDFYLAGIENRLDAFSRFRDEHPNRMKQPGITRGQ